MRRRGSPNQALISDGTAAAPGLAFTSDPNTGIFLNAAGNLAVSDESQEVAEFNSVGTAVEVNVGGEGTVTDVAFNVGNGATADDVSINMLSSAAGGSVHITAAQGTAPAAVAGGGFAGATSTATSTDLAGTVDFTSAAGAGTIAITYATAYATTPHVVVTPGIGDTFTALPSVGQRHHWFHHQCHRYRCGCRPVYVPRNRLEFVFIDRLHVNCDFAQINIFKLFYNKHNESSVHKRWL